MSTAIYHSCSNRGFSSHGRATCVQPVCAVSVFQGKRLRGAASNGSMQRCRMAAWLENKASIDVPLPLEPCWSLWDDREKIPIWMPWIKSVKVQTGDTRLSKWTLATNQFGRDWEFSWLARNLAPVKGQKIHWVSEPGSTSAGIDISNKGQIRFVKKSPTLTNITLTISYEVPDVLVPFANLLTPVVENILAQDMEKFKNHVLSLQQSASAAPVAQQ
mmetsp:Transcript_1027/g.1670  ORF Transcript_1027/g.1670 Transcript_1027/m.1670 type:complete len:217 (-) Transcript_1027:386-1036(-)